MYTYTYMHTRTYTHACTRQDAHLVRWSAHVDPLMQVFRIPLVRVRVASHIRYSRFPAVKHILYGLWPTARAVLLQQRALM